MAVLHLNEQEVRELLPMEEAISAVEAAFRKLAIEEAFNVPRTRCQTDGAMLHVLSASAKTMGVIGFKSYVTTRTGATFHVTIYDAKTGQMLAIMQADHLGRIRTGAASGVASKYLARPDAKTLGIYGSGKQARTQILAVAKVRPIEIVHVFSPNEERRQQFAQELSAETGLRVLPVATPEAAALGMDIICTATSAREPVLKGEWLVPGQHLNIIGSNFLAKSEIDLEVVKRSSLVCIDSRDQGKAEAGDFVESLEKNLLNWFDIQELGRIVAMRTPGRESPEDITLFKSLGLGLEDIAVAIKVYQKAKANGVGRELEL